MTPGRRARSLSSAQPTMTRLFALTVLLASTAVARLILDKQFELCDFNGCKCQSAGHPSWIQVNCTMKITQQLDILDGYVPELATELIVHGGETLMLGTHSMSRLKDLRHVQIYGTKMVVLKQGAAANLNVVNAFIEIEHVDVLRVEKRTFSNIRGPLTVTIRNCDHVVLEGDAFSWLLKITINNIRTLVLGTNTFTLDPTATNVGVHGPGMSIELRNLSTAEIPSNAFGSSAAEIVLNSVTVRAIRTGAFSANTYNVITAKDCDFHIIEEKAFAQQSLINNLNLERCTIRDFGSKALQSAVTKLNFSHSRFYRINSGAINTTVATVTITSCEFNLFMARGFILHSWNKLYMERNKFDDLAPYAIVAPTTFIHNLFFVENDIEIISENSLEFIGQTLASRYRIDVVYKNNYFGYPCNCNISLWIAKVMGSKDGDLYERESYCTVNEIFARCFNEPEQNILVRKFLQKVCHEDTNIQCEAYKTKHQGKPTEIKNPRFPHNKEGSGLSERNKKVLGIVVVTCLGCVVIVMLISLIKWMNQRGYCTILKNIFILPSSCLSCGSLCSRLCVCGRNRGIDNARSISQLSMHEYSERHRLNEPGGQETMMEIRAGASGTPPMSNTSPMNNIFTIEQSLTTDTPMDDKTTQTLPEELTKELLENLKEKLDDPENYVEAREMIEHLYELIKVEESCNTNAPNIIKDEENIYELPFQNTTPRIGKNKKQMTSVGTKAPSLEKLLPLSPYNRQTALAHEYFEPKDFAVHLYAEINNCEKERRSLLGRIPDIVEQVVPRGSLVKAVREKNSNSSSSPSYSSPTKSPTVSPATIKSIKSTGSNSSGKMVNRPLPEKPMLQPGEGTSSAATTER